MGTATFRLVLLFHVFAFLSSLRTAGHDAFVTVGGPDHQEHAVAITANGLSLIPPLLTSFVLLFPSFRQIRGFTAGTQELETTTTKEGDHGGAVVVWGSSVPWWEWDNPAAPLALRAVLCRLYAEAYCGSFCRNRNIAPAAGHAVVVEKKNRHRHVLLYDDAAVGDGDDELQRCRLRCVAVADLPCHALGTGSPYYSVIFDRLRWLVMNALSLLPWVLLATTWIIAYFLLKNRMDNEMRTEICTIEYFSADEGVNLPQSNIDTVASIDLPTMERATGGFSKRNIIGEGGFAIVYKGKLPRNHVLARDLHYQRKIAVKRLKPSALSTKGLNDFSREVELMSRLRHGNLSRLLAYCIEGDERILVYEYMPKKSLDVYIFGTPKHRASLNWAKRLEIIHGMAQGVNYLHDGSGETVIHRDLKPSNVLLDDEFTPRIADFGATKPLVADDTGTQTIVFSSGYAAPEYIRGDVTLKCDVYSFGVVLLEIVSGQKNSLRPSLLSKAWKLWDEHRIMDLVDQSMVRSCCEPELQSRVRRCIQIGLLCVQDSPCDRPTMSQVLLMLTSGSSQMNKPKPPAVFEQNHH